VTPPAFTAFYFSNYFYPEETMAGSFYDKVAKKFGVSGPQVQHSTEYSAGDPEQFFEQQVLESCGKDRIALDAGCGSGGLTLRIAPQFHLTDRLECLR
jgi:hypothetical protein